MDVAHDFSSSVVFLVAKQSGSFEITMCTYNLSPCIYTLLKHSSITLSKHSSLTLEENGRRVNMV